MPQTVQVTADMPINSALIRSVVVLVAGLLAVGVIGRGFADNPGLPIQDDFENGEISKELWYLGQAHPELLRLQSDIVRHGDTALAIQIGPEETDPATSQQRNELRVADPHQLTFGTDAWYGFSFRVDGDVDRTRGVRWVVGQWKEDTDRSPFLAQRFDNGIFHITVQDGRCRLLVTTSQTPQDVVGQNVVHHDIGRFAYIADKHVYDCQSDVQIEWGDDPLLPDPYETWVDMAYRVKGGRNGDGLIEIWADGRFIARVTGPIGNHDPSGPMQYFKFGTYRDATPGTATVYFDNFRRGESREEVDPSLISP